MYDRAPSPDETTVFEYHDLDPPTTADVYRARPVVRDHLPRTPLVRAEALSAELDADVYLKREDTLPTGAFKVRGGVTLAERLEERFHERGLIAASTGNHGQSVAYAGREVGVPVTVVVPEDANPGKVAAMERFGATVRFSGETFDDAREHAEELAATEGYRYVHSANEPALVAGVGTAGLEVVEDLPEVDVLFCPVGGGSSASGYCLTVGAVADADVVGVQSAAAPAMHDAWATGDLSAGDRMDTFAEGVATRVPFAMTTAVLRERLADFLLVPDDAIRERLRWLIDEENVVMEGACAAAVAGLFATDRDLAGETVVVPVSGRNLATDRLRDLL